MHITVAIKYSLLYFHIFLKDNGANCQKVISVFTDGPTDRAANVFKTHNKEKEVGNFVFLF